MKFQKEIQRSYRNRKGNSLKQKEKERSKIRRANASEDMKEKWREQARTRMYRMRQKKKVEVVDTDAQEDCHELASPYLNQSAESKALSRYVF
jgi:hypothetical protein